MIIDLHNHTTRYSLCSMIMAESLIELYLDRGVEGLCITEHNTVWPLEQQKMIKESYGGQIKVFFGMEIDTDIGHVLLFGEELDQYVGCYSIAELAGRVTGRETALIWAHPFRWRKPDHFYDYELERIAGLVDAVELYNGNVSPAVIKLTEQKLSPYGVNFTGGSDTHSTAMALKYATKFESEINNSRELAVALKSGSYSPYIFT